MQKYIILMLSVLFTSQLSAWTLYDQLCYFNFNWEKHQELAPKAKAIDLESDQEYVSTHLSYVIPILKSNPTNHLNERQYRTRLQLIETLDEYRKAGNFPINYFCRERTPVFIDENGTHCAVGYLLQQSGYDEVAQRIAENENYAWVKDIKDEAIPALQVESGFTLEEVKLIQGAYDFYMPNAFFAPNKYEIPQKPECMVAHFDEDEKAVWCYGEGQNGILNGRWIQNYSPEYPWIIGFYSKGKRTGQWKEYYQGTNQLCRTENWRNDKLNGVRTRFNREGKIIEEIIFKDGNAVTKTNYDLQGNLKWVRKPLDSNLVKTEVFTLGGALIASGNERVHNPGNLLWFQNIELTALNTFAITSRDVSQGGGTPITNLYNTPPLVEYKKEGEWNYYMEYQVSITTEDISYTPEGMFEAYYIHFGNELYQSIHLFEDFDLNAYYDSIHVTYEDNLVQDFYGYGDEDYTHLSMEYHQPSPLFIHLSYIDPIFYGHSQQYTPPSPPPPHVKAIGAYNENNEKIGVWRHYDSNGQLYKTENYIIPWRDEEVTLPQLVSYQ